MRHKNYYPQLISALRATLRHLEENKLVSSEDPTLLELKAAILRTLAEHERLIMADAAAAE